jgi:hypothetical protein
MRQREPRLDKLKAAIDKARAEQRRPLEPGEESRPLYPLQAYLDEAGMREVWKVVGALRERERPLANRFLGEVSLGDLIIDLVGDLDHVPTWRELCELLEQTADAQREWIVAIPLANLTPPTQPPSLVARLWRWLRRSRPERDNRWGRVTERYDVWKQLRASYSQREIRDAQRLARDLRNLAAHSAHAVLANLGFTATATRALGGARVVTGEELGLARAATALPVVRCAVHETATRLWRGALENGFDDVWWDAQFAAPRN